MGGSRAWRWLAPAAVTTVVAALGAPVASAAVKEFGLPTPSSQPAGIATGPDGSLLAAELAE